MDSRAEIPGALNAQFAHRAERPRVGAFLSWRTSSLQIMHDKFTRTEAYVPLERQARAD